MVRELDFYVLECTLKLMDRWKRNGMRLIPVSVNFSRQTLVDPSSLAAALEMTKKYDIPLELIEIEITERVGAIENATVKEACEKFRSQGFRLSLDDFGSEYSSISVLANISFDTVKLDKSIINDLVTNKTSWAIVSSIVGICADIGSDCIAEGVETEEQVKALLKCGCCHAQGYYYNKALPAEEFEQKYIAK